MLERFVRSRFFLAVAFLSTAAVPDAAAQDQGAVAFVQNLGTQGLHADPAADVIGYPVTAADVDDMPVDLGRLARADLAADDDFTAIGTGPDHPKRRCRVLAETGTAGLGEAVAKQPDKFLSLLRGHAADALFVILRHQLGRRCARPSSLAANERRQLSSAVRVR